MSVAALTGFTIGVTAGRPAAALGAVLERRGARIVYGVQNRGSIENSTPLRKLIDMVGSHALDAVGFTSAPAARNFFHIADELHLSESVQDALRGAVAAVCLGPAVAKPFLRRGIPVQQPELAQLGALAQLIADGLTNARVMRLEAAGHRLEVRGHGAIVDDAFVPLASTPMALLRVLAARPGRVLSRDDLVRIMPGNGGDGHAVEVAIGRLRTSLGDPALITTVVKRGYRLAP